VRVHTRLIELRKHPELNPCLSNIKTDDFQSIFLLKADCSGHFVSGCLHPSLLASSVNVGLVYSLRPGDRISAALWDCSDKTRKMLMYY